MPLGGGGLRPIAVCKTKNGRAQPSAELELKSRALMRTSVADLRRISESKKQFEAFVAGHETRVESAKLRAASESGGR